MLYLTLAAILIGSCAIETSAKKLVVTSTSDNTSKNVTVHAREVTPTTKGRVGWVIICKIMETEFSNLDFNKKLSGQLTATFDEKPLKHLAIIVNMWPRDIPVPFPADIVATYTYNEQMFGLYLKEGIIEWSYCYFEADEE